MVEFLGYSEAVSEDEDVLEVGQQYLVKKVDAKTKAVVLQIDNPDFDEDEEESDDNPRHLLVDAFANEVKDAPVAAKGRAAAKGKAAPKAEEEQTEPEDKYGALDTEDAEIVEMIEGADILELAEEVAEETASVEWKLGGILYHVRLTKAYQSLDDRYAQKGGIGLPSGFELYLNEVLNLEYRKAMHLIEIYHHFNQYGIDGAKLAEIGWTKASKIVRVMDEDNAAELVELAETQSVSELSDTIKETYVSDGGTKGDKRRKIVFKFRLWEDQAKAVEETLLAATEAMGFKDVADTFEHIVMEWAAEHPISAPAETKASSKATGKVESKGKKAASAKASAA